MLDSEVINPILLLLILATYVLYEMPLKTIVTSNTISVCNAVDGTDVGWPVGTPVGCVEGLADGCLVGCPDGLLVGCLDGSPLGSPEGLLEGFEGINVGVQVGVHDGINVGVQVGITDGCLLGMNVGGAALVLTK